MSTLFIVQCSVDIRKYQVIITCATFSHLNGAISYNTTT